MFELSKLFFSIPPQEEVLRLLQTPEPQSPLEILISKMQIEQDRLNQLKAKLGQLDYSYQKTNSPDCLMVIILPLLFKTVRVK